MYTDLFPVKWSYEIRKCTEEIWECWLSLHGLQCEPNCWHTKMV